ncbi:MAG TPA: DJ-1/PfpI family protein [Pyrinomonadaceae bacterium]|jgi:transcriptional regulator GlxA family with amidase domain|nr:DJ-1/PfpI family protein [Pyrinomonadaceae bacterium]
MKRRDFLANTAAAGIVVAASSIPFALTRGGKSSKSSPAVETRPESNKLTPPAKGRIPVAFAISEGVTVIDFAGPWEVFQDVMIDGRGEGMDPMPFQLYTVSEKTEPVRGSAGLKLVPDYTFETAPQPKIVVIPAQRGSSALHEWLRKVSRNTDVTFSVCTGAFQLAKAGLLSGKSATTHHLFQDDLAKQYPNIDVKRGVRFVEGDKIASAGGLTSGIDLALRVVERYFGREVAQTTADYMEYQSKGWIV